MEFNPDKSELPTELQLIHVQAMPTTDIDRKSLTHLRSLVRCPKQPRIRSVYRCPTGRGG